MRTLEKIWVGIVLSLKAGWRIRYFHSKDLHRDRQKDGGEEYGWNRQFR